MHSPRETTIKHLFENMQALKRAMSGFVMNRDCPVPPSQLELLFAIRHAQPVSFKHLAQVLYLTPGAVSQLAEGLEQHKLISRHADEQDRRIQCLQVSKKGRELLKTIETRRQSLMETMMQGLTDEELATWLRVQEKMLRHLQQEITAEHTKKENA